jgi:hypothetical protein
VILLKQPVFIEINANTRFARHILSMASGIAKSELVFHKFSQKISSKRRYLFGLKIKSNTGQKFAFNYRQNARKLSQTLANYLYNSNGY